MSVSQTIRIDKSERVCSGAGEFGGSDQRSDPSNVSSVSLEQHGWKGCVIPLSLENVEEHLPTWQHLQLLRPPETYGSRIFQIPYESIVGNLYPAYQILDQLDEGTYGKIMKANRAIYRREDTTHFQRIEEFAEIVCKIHELKPEEGEEGDTKERNEWYAEEAQAILHEASLHALAFHTLKSHGFPHAIPQLYEVYAISAKKTLESPVDINSIVIGMEFVEGETLHTYFAKQFRPATSATAFAHNDRLLMDTLIQLAIYLEVLQSSLRFNHRDLKINNVLRRRHIVPWSRTIEHAALRRPWTALHDLVIIDFGFSCVACDDSRKSLIQAGSWFKPQHDCLKSGRDIALFLYCLEAFYPLETRISPRFLQILQKAMTFGDIHLLSTNLDKHGRPNSGRIDFCDGIYKLLRREDVDVPGCAPRAILEAVDGLR
jgi:serine/threonine protein kinase